VVVFARPGSFIPSRLHRLLLIAGVDVIGVTNDDTSVQIICADGTAQANVDAVLAAYPFRVQPNDTPTRNLIAAVRAVVQAADFPHAQSNLQSLVAPTLG